jgi:hypothetical protein
MATKSNNTAETDRERLAAASLEGCYLDTLLAVIESMFEEIDSECDIIPENYSARSRIMARQGLNLTYMAHDKAAAVKRLTDDVEKEIWLAERIRREDARP